MKEISLDLRRRIVDAYVTGRTGTYEETAEMFGVGRASVSRFLRRHRQTGDVRAKPRGGNNPRLVDLDWLLKDAETNPDARLSDRINAWHERSGCRVSVGAMWNALRVIGWSHKKKTLFAQERDRKDVREKREEYIANQATLEPGRLIFLDESGFRLGAPPHYGWAPRGEKSRGTSVQGAWQTMTMVGAIALDGFRGLMTVDAATCAEVFRAFVEHELVPRLRPGDIVVMDNLSVHKDAEAHASIRAAGAEVLFLPPYSPELNPIEKVWSKMKTLMRRLDTLTRETFDAAVAAAMDTVTPADIRAWVAHAGYDLRSR